MPGSSPEDKVEGNEATVDATKVEGAQTEPNSDAKQPVESSAAEPQDAKGDLLSQVKAALEPKKESSSTSQTEGSKADNADKPAEGGEQAKTADDLTPEELAKLKPKTRARIENLTADKVNLKRQLDELEPKARRVDELEPKATSFDQLVRYVEDAGLTKDEVNQGFDVMRDLKANPLKAYETLKPIMDQLEGLVGARLPDDLQQAVNQGQITEAYARDLARSKSVAALSTQQVQQRDTRDQTRQQQQDFETSQSQVSDAVAKWESSKAGSDPEWKQKQARVMQLVELETLKRERQDRNFRWTPEDAVKFADKALSEVTGEIKRLAPKPKAVTPITDVASSRSVTKPTTAVEAAKASLAAMTAA